MRIPAKAVYGNARYEECVWLHCEGEIAERNIGRSVGWSFEADAEVNGHLFQMQSGRKRSDGSLRSTKCGQWGKTGHQIQQCSTDF